jgi:hypothetical protein
MKIGPRWGWAVSISKETGVIRSCPRGTNALFPLSRRSARAPRLHDDMLRIMPALVAAMLTGACSALPLTSPSTSVMSAPPPATTKWHAPPTALLCRVVDDVNGTKATYYLQSASLPSISAHLTLASPESRSISAPQPPLRGTGAGTATASHVQHGYRPQREGHRPGHQHRRTGQPRRGE